MRSCFSGPRAPASSPGSSGDHKIGSAARAPATRCSLPPPPDRLNECLDALEKFLHVDDPQLPPLIKAGLAHVQFETIHPFLDGNGRLGRLLITLHAV